MNSKPARLSDPSAQVGGPTVKTSARRLLGLVAFVVLAAIVVEAGSSYVLFRHFAKENKSFTPVGSSTYQLIDHAVLAVRGEHKRVQLTSDKFPLFSPDEILGYAMIPGSYQIIEDYDNHKHTFHMQVTDARTRATSNVPVKAAHRLLFTGDSSMFGWALNDEQTIPWLLQSQMPNDEILNLSLTSYSTVQTLLQLQNVSPAVGPDDTFLLLYHPVTNDFNVAVPSKLVDLIAGYELQLGDHARMLAMKLPYGALDAQGNLAIRRVELSCAIRKTDPDCVRPMPSPEDEVRITKLLFDQILALHPGHVMVAFVSGPDNDPVIAHLKSQGAAIADLRLADDEPDAKDEMATDKHAGPFWQSAILKRLHNAMLEQHLVH